MTSSIRRALAARSCSAVTAPSLGGHAPGHRERVPHAETGGHTARFAGVLGQGRFPPLEVRAGRLVEGEHDRGGGDSPDPEADAHGGRRVLQGSLEYAPAAMSVGLGIWAIAAATIMLT